MNKQLIYSILQYKHSPILREAINIGVLFYFPEETRKLYLNITDSTRLRSIYENFDNSYFNTSVKIIQSNVEKCSDDCFAQELLLKNFSKYINDYLLKEDDTALQFTDPFTTINVFSSPEKVIEEYTRLLLPVCTKKRAR